MSGFHLPRKANPREIITVKGYEGILFLVGGFTEEIEYDKDGILIAETVLYTCTDIDNYKTVKIIFDVDVDRIVCPAHESDAYIERRQKSAGLPVVQPPQDDPNDLRALMERYMGLQVPKNTKKPPEKKVVSKYELERQERAKEQEYIDFLLDKYNDLATLEAVLGKDADRTTQMELVRKEFEKRTGNLIDEKPNR